MSFYPAAINKYLNAPLNVGSLERTPARGRATSFVCGAALSITLQFEHPTAPLEVAKFQATGCGYLIAAASVTTEIIKGLRLEDVAELAQSAELCEETLNRHFGGVPGERRQCLQLCREALADAVRNYRQASLAEWAGDDALICVCFGVAEKTIEDAIAAGNLETINAVTRACKAGAGCGSCRSLIAEILDNYWQEQARELRLSDGDESYA